MKIVVEIVLDAGPIISLLLSGNLFILERFKKYFDVDWIIPKYVKYEVVDKAFQTKSYMCEALEVLNYMTKKIITLVEDERTEVLRELIINLSNNLFFVNDNPIKVLDLGEAEVFGLILTRNVELAVIDEISARLLIEDIEKLRKRFEEKLHTKVALNEENKKILIEKFRNLKVCRSAELVLIAFENGFYDDFRKIDTTLYQMNNIDSIILESLLWKLKKSGCAITEEEIYNLINYELSERKQQGEIRCKQ